MAKQPWLFSTALVSILFLCVGVLGTVAFDTNDDGAMMMISSGYLTGMPAETLIYSSVVIGKILQALYGIAPAWNWYLILHGALLFVACSVILTQLVRRYAYQRRIVALLSGLFIPALLSYQYTNTAFFCTLAGWMLLWSALENRISWLRLLGAAFLLLIGLCVRWHVFLVVLLFQVPIWCFGYWLKTARRWLIRLVLALIVSAVFLLGYFVVERAYYASYYADNEVFAYQSAFDKIVNGPGDIDQKALQTVQWTSTDLLLARAWAPIDTKVHTASKIITLADQIQGKVRTMRSAAGQLYYLLIEDWALILVLAGVWWFLFKQHNGVQVVLKVGDIYRIRFSLLLLITICVLLFCLVALFTFRLPHRLFYPLCTTQLLTIFYFNTVFTQKEQGNKVPDFEFYRWLWIPVVGFLALYCWQINTRNISKRAHAQIVFEWIQAHSNQIFVAGGSALPYEGLCSLQNPATTSRHNIIPTGWVVNTPVYADLMSKRSVTNLMTDLNLRRDFIFIDMPIQEIKMSLSDRYGQVFETTELPKGTYPEGMFETTPRTLK